MKLVAVTIQKFKNIVDPQRVEIEPDVTGFVGKNESGKTTVLKALHRLNPANDTSKGFDLTTEYPRWRLAKDRRNEDLEVLQPVVAEFLLDEDDLSTFDFLTATPPIGTVVKAGRSYNNELSISLFCPVNTIIETAAKEATLSSEDVQKLKACSTISEAQTVAKELTKSLKDSSEALRSKAMAVFEKSIGNYAYLQSGHELDGEAFASVSNNLPKFFYFSQYNILPGECNLTELAAKYKSTPLTEAEQTVISLLAHAGETPEDFLDSDYDSRKAELQAASADLSQNVFEYWKQNTDLDVVFDTDNVMDNSSRATKRILKIELRDGRHGNVETNFSTRSTGFQWFFSFFAAFSEYKRMEKPIIVLLDEPGTSLHGEAQKDFVRFVFEELGVSKQTLYTTHSQFMVDPTRYEKLRAVHDSATRENHNKGVVISKISLAADHDTLLPIESALGYSISQHLFIGSGQHLVVEGSSDFIFLQRFTEYLGLNGKQGLDPKFSMIPVGSIDNMPAFVALLGRRLKVSALVDGIKTSSRVDRIKAAARSNNVPETAIIACSQASSDLPDNADIEDLFDLEDYLKLYNLAFDSNLQASQLAQTTEPVLKRIEQAKEKYDHALPAHALTEHREEFFKSVSAKTVSRFEKLFEILNATIQT